MPGAVLRDFQRDHGAVGGRAVGQPVGRQAAAAQLGGQRLPANLDVGGAVAGEGELWRTQGHCKERMATSEALTFKVNSNWPQLMREIPSQTPLNSLSSHHSPLVNQTCNNLIVLLVSCLSCRDLLFGI